MSFIWDTCSELLNFVMSFVKTMFSVSLRLLVVSKILPNVYRSLYVDVLLLGPYYLVPT
jgi:hypothetical protein